MRGEHFRLGLFVIVSVAILVAILLLFGTLERFKPVLMLVTTFSEPIRGLQSGAAVEYRGLKVGTVGRVALASPQSGSWRSVSKDSDHVERVVVAELRIDEAVLDSSSPDVRAARLQAMIDAGFRAQLDTQGLGGPTFIQIDRVDSKVIALQKPVPPDTGLFLPSAPSAVGTIISEVDTLLVTINEENLIGKLAAIGDLGPKLDRLLDSTDGSSLLTSVESAMGALNRASSTADRVLADPRIGTLLDNASTTMQDVKGAIRDGREDLKPMMNEISAMAQSLRQASEALNGVMESIDRTGIVGDLDRLVADVRPTLVKLDELATRVDRLVGDTSGPIADAIRRLGRAASELEALLEEAQANPSRFIFGAPPPKGTPGAKP